MKTFDLLPILLASLAVAGESSSPIGPRQWNTQDVSQTYQSSPWRITDEDWASLMAKPDLERVFPIEGHNISAPDDEDTIDGWTISLSVRTEMPADEYIDVEDSDATFSGSLVRLNPPSSIAELAQVDLAKNGSFSILDPSWHVCYSVFNFFPLEKREKITTDDGSCRSVFSDECIRAIETSRNTSGFNDNSCAVPSIPDECDHDGIGASNRISGTFSTLEGDVEWLDGSQIRSVATDGRSRGDNETEAIDRVTRHTDFIIVSWIHNTTETTRRVVSQSIVCPKALNASDFEGENEDDAGGEGNEADNDDGDSNEEGDGNGESAGSSLSAPLAACLFGALVSYTL